MKCSILLKKRKQEHDKHKDGDKLDGKDELDKEKLN